MKINNYSEFGHSLLLAMIELWLKTHKNVETFTQFYEATAGRMRPA
ncbi:MAG: hypothetical protein P8012_06015 [Desulfobacterales bacterium]